VTAECLIEAGAAVFGPGDDAVSELESIVFEVYRV